MVISHYNTLEILPNSTNESIKLAYRKLSLQYHPDRLLQATDSERADGEERMKSINHAYEVLGDPLV